MRTIYENDPTARREAKRYRGERGANGQHELRTNSRALVMIWAWWWAAQGWYVLVEDLRGDGA